MTGMPTAEGIGLYLLANAVAVYFGEADIEQQLSRGGCVAIA